MKRLALALMAVLSFSTASFAHEGHDKMPGSVQAPHGGVVKGTDELYIEVINEPGGLKIYPLTHDLEPVAVEKVTLTGTAQVPKKKKETLAFKKEKDHFTAKPNVKGAYRYSLDLAVTYDGKKEKVSFQIEPQS